MVLLYHVFFLNDTATTEIYTYRHTLSLHAALPIYSPRRHEVECRPRNRYHSVVDIYAHSGLAADYVEHWISRAPLNNRMIDGPKSGGSHQARVNSLRRGTIHINCGTCRCRKRMYLRPSRPARYLSDNPPPPISE